MKKFTVLAAVLSLAITAQAQRSGSANRAAPTVTTAIAFADAKLSVDYVAMTWAEGKTMKMIMDKENGAAMRERISAGAAKSPVGTLSATADFDLGGKKVAAGDYSLYFTIDGDLKWHMVLASKSSDSTIDWTLDLKDTDHSGRLQIAIMAGVDDGTAAMRIAFGKQSCKVGLSPAKSDG